MAPRSEPRFNQKVVDRHKAELSAQLGSLTTPRGASMDHITHRRRAWPALLATFALLLVAGAGLGGWGCAHATPSSDGKAVLHGAPNDASFLSGQDVAVACKILTIDFNPPLDAARNSDRLQLSEAEQIRAPSGRNQGTKLSTINVSSTEQLSLALKSAKAGDTILLDSGTYSNVSINGLKFSTDINIQSKDPGRPAVITDLMLKDSQGINFANLEFSNAGSTKMGGSFQVQGSSDIEFKNLYVHGSLDNNPANDVDGFRILNSPNVTIKDSEFAELRIAIGHRDSDGLTISGNEIHDIRMDGVRGSGSSNVVITKNYFTDFYRVEGDHADAIQFYTGNTTKSAENITITENVIVRGDGIAMQGIFLRDENGGLAYNNVKISDNVVIGTMPNGIAVIGGKNVQISNNTLGSDPGGKTWIRVNDTDGAVVSNNSVNDDNSAQYLYKNVIGLKEAGNSVGGPVTDGGLSLLGKWLSIHPTVKSMFSDTDLGKLQAKPGDVVQVPAPSVPSDAIHNVPVDGGQGGGAAVGGTLHSGAGDDHLVGGAGADTVSYSSVTSSVRVDLSATGKQNTLGGGKDTLVNVNNIVGSSSNDTLTGNSEDNTLVGGDGNDKLVGGIGADKLYGGKGADSFHVGALEDSTVDLSGRDTIFDFKSSEGDRIILRDIDAIKGGGDDPFTFVAKFTGVAGQLTTIVEGDHYVVMGDVNGDGLADFAINVHSETALTRADFLL